MKCIQLFHFRDDEDFEATAATTVEEVKQLRRLALKKPTKFKVFTSSENLRHAAPS